jgi:hypothetical protein
VVVLLGGVSLMGPVMAADDYDNGDYAAAPRMRAMPQATQTKNTPKPVVNQDDYDNGDYAAAPRVRPTAQVKKASTAPRPDANKLATAAPTPVAKKSTQATHRYIEAFE